MGLFWTIRSLVFVTILLYRELSNIIFSLQGAFGKILLLFSHWVMSESLRPHGLQHARLPCPSPFPGVAVQIHALPWSGFSSPLRVTSATTWLGTFCKPVMTLLVTVKTFLRWPLGGDRLPSPGGAGGRQWMVHPGDLPEGAGRAQGTGPTSAWKQLLSTPKYTRSVHWPMGGYRINGHGTLGEEKHQLQRFIHTS